MTKNDPDLESIKEIYYSDARRITVQQVGWLLGRVGSQNAKIEAVRNVASNIAVGWDQEDLSPVQLTYAQAFMEAAKRIFIALDDEETAHRISEMSTRIARDRRND